MTQHNHTFGQHSQAQQFADGMRPGDEYDCEEIVSTHILEVTIGWCVEINTRERTPVAVDCRSASVRRLQDKINDMQSDTDVADGNVPF